MATVTLIFVDIARSERLLFESQKSNVNLSSKETNTFVIPIVGKDIVALTEYRVSYNIKYGRYGDLQKTAAIFQVKIRALNATNCWSDVQLVYDEADASRQFNVSVTPNECSIESQVVVELQFNFPVTGWRGFEINPTVTADPTFRGFVSKSAYDHSTVHFFNQSFDSLSGES